MATPTQTLRQLALLACLTTGSAAANGSNAAAAVPGGPQPADSGLSAQTGTERLDELNQLSHALIEKAASGRSPAHQFRIEARIYRELLRRLMLDNRVLPADEQVPQALLLEMVRMSALLHSAADCKTGMVITCPPDLMRQLKAQQARLDQELRLRDLGAG